MKKMRLFMLDPRCNEGKVARLEALHAEYVGYVRACVGQMVASRCYQMPQSAKRQFFSPSPTLSSQIAKNAQDHAIQIVSAWHAATYARSVRKHITNGRREGTYTEQDAKALYTIGRKTICKPWNFITQQHLDTYHALLDEHGGNPPTVRDSLPMRLSEMTAVFAKPKQAFTADSWLAVSTLDKGKRRMTLPLVGNPYAKPSDVSKGITARKTKRGRWRFEAVEKTDWVAPTAGHGWTRLGVDVGLNVLAATSDGTTYGAKFKPNFDRAYAQVREVRANRQRQNLKENSPRLDRLESKLTGLIKTATGSVVNRLLKNHPETIFVVEDLDLRGCRGQKRFAYRALQTNLARKAPTEKVNPAYTSQECPSCHHISRRNRSGTKFHCRSCGREAHADWVGASGVLRRSQDKQITCVDHPSSVKRVLRERYLRKRNSSLRHDKLAPVPSGQWLTTLGFSLDEDLGTATNSIPRFT